MRKIERYIDLTEITKKKSSFLFGPRATGKSFWIRRQLPNAIHVDLLKATQRRNLLNDPSALREIAAAKPEELIVIDEVQLIPELLDEVHSLIEEEDRVFLLTGSSARKLKRQEANMLGGRAKKSEFFPLTWRELSSAGEFELNRYLHIGGLPRVYFSNDPYEELGDYVDTYLDREIKAEAVSRNVYGFEKFLYRSALTQTEILNFSSIANDAQISPPTVRQYYEVLEDTLLGFYLTPWKGKKRKAVQSAKFYLFDLGVQAFLAGIRSLPEQSDLYGRAFESFIVNEVRALCSLRRIRKELCFWRTTHQDEVDLIIGNEFAIEIKSGTRVEKKQTRSLMKLREEGFDGRLVLLSRDPVRRNVEDCELWFWSDFLGMLWESDWSKNPRE